MSEPHATTTAWTRPFDVGFAAGAAASGLLFLLVVRAGIYVSPPVSRGHYYTAAAAALLHGQLFVPKEILGGECFMVGGRCYGYFGITPSLLRLPVALRYEHAPSLAMEASFFVLGWFLTTLGAWWIARRLVRLWAPAAQPPRLRLIGCVTALAGLGASPLLFLAGRPLVYEEAILWGAAFASVAVGAAVSFLLRPRGRTLLVLMAANALGMLARPTVGASGLVATVVIGISLLRGGLRTGDPAGRRLSRQTGALLVAGALAAVALPAAVAVAKFGTASPPYRWHAIIGNKPERFRVYDHPGSVNPAVLPTKLLSILRPDSVRFFAGPPFVALGEKYPTVLWPARPSDVDWGDTAGLTGTLPFTVGAAAVGLSGVGAALRRRRGGKAGTAPDPTGLVLASVIAALGLGLVFPGQEYRYAADWLPLFFVAVPVGLALLARRQWTGRRAALIVGVGAALLAVQGLIQIGVAVHNGVVMGGERPEGCSVPNAFGAAAKVFCP